MFKRTDVVNNSTHVVIFFWKREGGFLWRWAAFCLMFTWKTEETSLFFRLIGFKSKLLTSSLASSVVLLGELCVNGCLGWQFQEPPSFLRVTAEDLLSPFHSSHWHFSAPVFLSLPFSSLPLCPQDQIIFGEEGGKGQLTLPLWDPWPGPFSPCFCNSHYHLLDKDCWPSPGLRLFFHFS